MPPGRDANASIRAMTRRLAIAFIVLMVAGAAPRGQAVKGDSQPIDAASMFRVFLTDGQAIPSFGESAVVGDRVIFTIIVGDGGARTTMQLVSLPASTVDVARTARYAEAMRAARYAATNGEADYAAMTAEVERSVAQLTKIEDPKRRLALAEEAKRRLLTWSQEHYSYRADDVQKLAGMFDEVIAELRVAVGESRFAFDLVAGSAAAQLEPLLPLPTLRESVSMALAAARASRPRSRAPGDPAGRVGGLGKCGRHGRPVCHGQSASGDGAVGRRRLRDAGGDAAQPGGRGDAAG